MSQIWFSYNGEKVIAKKQSVRFLQTWSFSEQNVEKTTESQIWFNYYGIIFFRKMTECQISPDIVVFRAKCWIKDYLLYTQKNLGITPPYITGRDVPAPKPSNGTPTKLMTVLSSLSFKLLNKLKIENLKICENFTKSPESPYVKKNIEIISKRLSLRSVSMSELKLENRLKTTESQSVPMLGKI